MRPDLKIFTFLHLAGLPEVAAALVKSRCTGIAYELVQIETGELPLLAPMSQIAGKLAAQNAAHHLLTQNGGRGILLGGTSKIAAGKVVVIGAGIAGQASAEIAAGLGARTSIFDINQAVLDRYSMLNPQVECFLNNSENLNAELRDADVVISAVLIPGARAPRVITEANLKKLKPGTVLVDISIDQGGSIEGIRATSLEHPTYEEDGHLFYAVPNMPSQAARTSTEALTAESLPYILEIAEKGFERATLENSALARAVCTQDGLICNEVIARALS